MKVKDIYAIGNNRLINAINLTTGDNYLFENTCIVTPIHGSFVEDNEDNEEIN